jgi:hypothetical protein
MFDRLAKFRLPLRRQAPPVPSPLVHANDNLQIFIRAGRRGRKPGRLVCRWFLDDGKLACRWELEDAGGCGPGQGPSSGGRSHVTSSHRFANGGLPDAAASSDIGGPSTTMGLADATPAAAANQIGGRHPGQTDRWHWRREASRHHGRKGRFGLKRSGGLAARPACGRQSHGDCEKADAARPMTRQPLRCDCADPATGHDQLERTLRFRPTRTMIRKSGKSCPLSGTRSSGTSVWKYSEKRSVIARSMIGAALWPPRPPLARSKRRAARDVA